MPLRMPNRSKQGIPLPFPSPIGGWNARDALSAMAVEQAVRLDNFFPGFGSVDMRRGHESYATGLGAQVKMLASFVNGATTKFIAGANGEIWDISSAGAAVSLASGFTENAWQTAQFDDSGGGARLGLVNGADAPQIYDGATVAAMTVSGTGLTVETLIGLHTYKSRSYFIQKNSASFWYSALNALGGVLTEFKLGRLSGIGGNLMAIDTWSIDAGNGPADVLCFFMSSGDVIVYTGSNPGSDFQLIGLYKIGAPIGRRCTQKIGSELYVITKSGYVPLSSAAKLGLVKQSVAISDNIRGAVAQAAESAANLGGWQAILYPRGNYGLFNVPMSANLFVQHVVNTETGAWCRFTRQNGYCWGLYNDRLYFGANGSVYLADQGRDDNGAAISVDAICAWNYLEAPGMLKQVTACRVLGQTDNGAIPYNLSIGVDFRDAAGSATGTMPATSTSPWDDSPWDTTPWATESAIFDSWNGAAGLGDAFSLRFRAQSSQSGFKWYSTNYVYKPGGIL